jgi:hypothetical protein
MRSGWWSRRAITLHVALVVTVPVFLLLATWQLRRALHGNLLSWAYTFEWPFFAAYVTWMWWKLVHEETAIRAAAAPSGAGLHGRGAKGGPTELPVVATSQAHLPATAAPASPAVAALVGPDRESTAALVGPDRESAAAAAATSMRPPALDWDPYDEADPELAAYNRYLAELHAERPKR